MASRPSGLRQPSSVKSSTTNIAAASGGAVGGNEPPSATPAGKGGSAIPMSRLSSSNSIKRKIITPAGINAPGSRDSGLATDIDHFIIGDVVYVSGEPTKRGKICFIGEVDFAKGDFAGIALDLPIGNHDGVVQGRRYFQCAASHGLFTKLNRLTRDPMTVSSSTPLAPQSMSSSAVMEPEPQVSSGPETERTPSPSSLSQHTPVKLASTLHSNLVVGERVIVASATGGTKIGLLKYLGPTEFAAGDWAGVELLTPMGKNNGSVKGKSYFRCKENHGLFVPVSKVISSPINRTPRRHGSRESLISVSSLASSAASRSIRRPSVRETQCLPTCSLQAVLAEKEKHMERLMKERELDRVDLANLSRQLEDKCLDVKRLESECSGYKHQLSTSIADSEVINRLQNAIEEERRKQEDLQYTLDEEKIMKADLQAQYDAVVAKSSVSEKDSELLQAEREKHSSELKELDSKLGKQAAEFKDSAGKLVQAQSEIQLLQKTIEQLTANNSSQLTVIAEGKVEKENLVKAHQEVVAAMKKTATEHGEGITKLIQELGEKKRLEAEHKDKMQRIETELAATTTRNCSLEAEIIDLVNAKSDTSELLSGKINGLSQEVQELREKLQSAEEDKAVLRRINAEFKSRIAKYEENESGLKKALEEAVAKADQQRDSLQKVSDERFTAIEGENKSLLEEMKKRHAEIAELKIQASSVEKNAQEAQEALKGQLEQIQKLGQIVDQSASKLSECQQLLKKAEEEKASTLETAAKNEKELKANGAAMVEQMEKLNVQLSTAAREVSVMKQEIEALQSGISKSKVSFEEKSAKVKSLEDEITGLKGKLEGEQSIVQDLQGKLGTLKKDKSALREQASSFKEIEKGLSQELLSVRSQLEQKLKEIIQLEKELSDKRTEMESSKASMLDASSPQSHIDFLNSIIVDLQRKNEELNVKLNVLINGGRGDADANSNRVGGAGTARPFHSLRPYCDICEKFDLHDTEDCPAQASEDNSHYGSSRGEPRPYCETCEIFGHVTGECDDQETY